IEEEDFREILQLTEALKLTKGDIEKGKLNIPKYRAMYLNGILKNSHAIHFERDSRFRSLIREMGSVEDSDYEVPSSLQTIMRDYQKMGFRWLKTMKNFGFSAILADDMGLGKTLQVISLLVDHVEHQQNPMCVNQVALVVCPASLVLNWEKEIQKFTPQLRATPVIGTAAERKRILAECAGENPPHVLITSYDLLKRDIMHYENMTFDYHIIDEAQNIKNHSTQNAKAVKAIKSVTRFALTGTPIENRLSELWSIFDFLMPQYFYGYAQFKERYEKAIIKDGDEQQMNLLKKQVEPFVLRRLKSSVLKELPEKSESVVYAKMTG
ncbi:MAG: SNF2-related protein, partial [Anaerovorax sp.]